VLEDREGVWNKPPITQEEAVKNLLCHLDTHKSMGEYGIHPRVLRESQNHRMVGVGRDVCGSSSPTPLPKQGHLQ